MQGSRTMARDVEYAFVTEMRSYANHLTGAGEGVYGRLWLLHLMVVLNCCRSEGLAFWKKSLKIKQKTTRTN